MAESSNHTSASLFNESIAYFDQWRKELLKGSPMMRPSDLSVARLVDTLIKEKEDRKTAYKAKEIQS